MNPGSQGIFVASAPATLFVRVVGRGGCRNSVCLRACGLERLQLGCREIVLDLRDCESMDSTFLGVIAGFAFSLGSAGSLTLLDMNSDACRALSELGLDQLPSLHTGVAAVRERLPSESEFRLLPGSEPAVKPSSVDAIDRAVLMLESHEYLCRIDRRNEEKFREVKEFLRQDIARRGGQGH